MSRSDVDELTRLNLLYLDSVAQASAAQFEPILAIIHAATAFTLPDGRTGRGRYTDVWARRDGRWLAVSAHVTRMM